jgi:hypothetical protein
MAEPPDDAVGRQIVEARKLRPRKALQSNHKIGGFRDDVIRALGNSPDLSAIVTYRPLVIEIQQSMWRQWLGRNKYATDWLTEQTPTLRMIMFFDQQIPVLKGMIVQQDAEAWCHVMLGHLQKWP